MSFGAAQSQGVVIKATRWPPCECGEAYGLHVVGACHGYRPSKPVEDLGTRGYMPPLSLALWRRIVCVSIWAVEHRLQGWRERIGLIV